MTKIRSGLAASVVMLLLTTIILGVLSATYATVTLFAVASAFLTLMITSLLETLNKASGPRDVMMEAWEGYITWEEALNETESEGEGRFTYLNYRVVQGEREYRQQKRLVVTPTSRHREDYE